MPGATSCRRLACIRARELRALDEFNARVLASKTEVDTRAFCLSILFVGGFASIVAPMSEELLPISVADVRPAARLSDALLALNNEHVLELSWLTPERLAHLDRLRSYADALVAYAPEEPLGGGVAHVRVPLESMHVPCSLPPSFPISSFFLSFCLSFPRCV